MDDPWGSPWATTDGDHDHDPKTPSPSKPQLELPRPTFAKLPSFSTHSPWGDEDAGFGDWASADQGATSGNGWGGWTGENGSNSSQQLTPMPRDDALDKASPIAWPGSIATSPNFNLKPVSRKTSSVFRHPSPDPWASEFSLTNAEPTIQNVFTDTTHSVEKTVPVVDTEANPENPINEEKIGNSNRATSTILKSVEAEEDEGEKENEELKKHRQSVDASGDAGIGDTGNGAGARISTRHRPETNLAESSTVQSITSRPSSPETDDSHHGEDRQDSPITSIDEDSRSRLQIPRKSSYKVQELVERFDALAKSSEDVVIVRQERSRSRTPGPDIKVQDTDSVNSDEENDADFGDFEDAVTRQSRRPSVQEVVVVPLQETVTSQPKTDKPPAQHVPLPDSRPATASEERPQSRGLDMHQLIDKFGPIKFETSLQDVNRLFDDAKLVALPVLESDSFVPDYVLNDSFTSISERKTWYRVSRQGTMRKHNLGNDENYKRVGWSNSTARIDTIKIVRRWMEEDSISGRPTLGGSSSKGHGFGWDSGAEPVTLDQVFGKKRKPVHAKSASAHQLRPPVPLTIPSTMQPLPPKGLQGEHHSSAHQALETDSSMGQFGWSAASIEEVGSPKSPPTSTIAQPQKRLGTQPATSFNGPRIPSSEQVVRPISMPPPIGAPLSIPSTKPELQDDDDDEWGDMVMSPAEDKGRPTASFEVTSHVTDVHNSANVWHLEKAFSPQDPQASQQVDAIATGPTQSAAAQNNGLVEPLFSSDISNVNGNSIGASTARPINQVQDPWGFAVFSTFDSTIPSITEQNPAPTKADDSLSSHTSQDPKQTLSWGQTSVTPTIAGLPSHTIENESEEILIRDILEALPNLSYMLR